MSAVRVPGVPPTAARRPDSPPGVQGPIPRTEMPIISHPISARSAVSTADVSASASRDLTALGNMNVTAQMNTANIAVDTMTSNGIDVYLTPRDGFWRYQGGSVL